MTTLSADLQREYESNEDPLLNDLPVIASEIIYEGAAVADNLVAGAGGGWMQPAVTNVGTFRGFAYRKADNSSGSDGDINVKVRQQGTVKLAIVGMSAASQIGDLVYASDDNAFTVTASTHLKIGRVTRWIVGTSAMVHFESASLSPT